MRTLSAELTTAQKAQAYTPHIELNLTSRTAAVTKTYKTDDATNRILRVRWASGMYGGSLFEIASASGEPVAIACQILLMNVDNEFTSLDLRGYKVEIKAGFESYVDVNGVTQAISGTKTSQGEPYFVYSQRETSSEGSNITELWCISAWQYLALQKIIGNTLGQLYKTTGAVERIRHVLLDALSTDPAKALYWNDSGTFFVDITASVATNDADYTLDMDDADIIYIAAEDNEDEEFDRVAIEFNREGIGTWTIAWQYWNGSTWAALSNFVDPTSRFTDVKAPTGAFLIRTFTFDHPADWASTSVDGFTGRWIRAVITTTNVNTTPSIRRLSIGMHWNLDITTPDIYEDSSAGRPELMYPYSASRFEVVRDMLDRTQSSLIMKTKAFEFAAFVVSPGSSVYTYDLAGHVFITDMQEQAVLIPNRIIATNTDGESAQTGGISRIVDNDASIAAFGVAMEIISDKQITDAGKAISRATRRLNRYTQEVTQGEALVPINIGQEPWDWVEIVDSRLAITITGRVARIINEYEHGEVTFRSFISLGMASSTPTISLREMENRAAKALQTQVDKVIENISETLQQGFGPALSPAFLFARQLISNQAALDAGNRAPIFIPRATSPFQTSIDQLIDELTLERDISVADALIRAELRRGGEELRASLPPIRTDSPFFNPNYITGTPETRAQLAAIPTDVPLIVGPSEAVGRGLPFWFGLLPQTGQYQPSKLTSRFGQGQMFDEPTVQVIKLRDFGPGTKYNHAVLYNRGDGALVIEDNAGPDTAVDELEINLDVDLNGSLVMNGGNITGAGSIIPVDTTKDLGNGTFQWFNLYVNTIKSNFTNVNFSNSIAFGVDKGIVLSGGNIVMGGGDITGIDDLIPASGSGHILGNVSNFWDEGWFDKIKVNNLAVQTGSEITVDNNLVATTGGSQNLGSAAKWWGDAYVQDLYVQNLRKRSGSAIVIYDSVLPSATGVKNFGSSNLAWFQVATERVIFPEITDPAGSSANTGTLYTKDNGSGKTQLVVIFNTGAVQVIATQP